MSGEKEFSIRKQYDRGSKIYDDRYSRLQRQKYSGFKAIGFQLDESLPIIDLGAGTCLFSSFTAERCIGLDISRSMLEHIRPSALTDRVVADLRFLPLRQTSIHQIVSFTAYQNLEDPQTAFRDLTNTLAENGHAFVSVLRYVEPFKSGGPQSLSNMLTRAGLTVDLAGMLDPEDVFAIVRCG